MRKVLFVVASLFVFASGILAQNFVEFTEYVQDPKNANNYIPYRGLKDANGKIIIEANTYHSMEQLKRGMYKAGINKGNLDFLYTLYSKEGKKISDEQYSSVYEYTPDFIKVIKAVGYTELSGFIDGEGKVIVPVKFQSGHYAGMKNVITLESKEGVLALYRNNGEEIVPPIYEKYKVKVKKDIFYFTFSGGAPTLKIKLDGQGNVVK